MNSNYFASRVISYFLIVMLSSFFAVQAYGMSLFRNVDHHNHQPAAKVTSNPIPEDMSLFRNVGNDSDGPQKLMPGESLNQEIPKAPSNGIYHYGFFLILGREASAETTFGTLSFEYAKRFEGTVEKTRGMITCNRKRGHDLPGVGDYTVIIKIPGKDEKVCLAGEEQIISTGLLDPDAKKDLIVEFHIKKQHGFKHRKVG